MTSRILPSRTAFVTGASFGSSATWGSDGACSLGSPEPHSIAFSGQTSSPIALQASFQSTRRT